MPALNFQARFADAVESGEKRQTIRKQRKRPFKKGELLWLYTGMRTRNCRLLRMELCKSVQPIAFGRMELGGQRGTWFQGQGYLKGIAKRDGFETEEQMLDWFEKTHGLPFEGVLIRW